MANTNELNPQVLELLKPIIYNTTKLYAMLQAQNSRPVFAQARHNESEEEQRIKRECVHMIFNADGGIEYILEDCNKDGYKRCPVCERLVPVKFEEGNEQKLYDTIEVLNQLTFFGIILNLRADAIKTLIGMKSILPDVVKLVRELNEYVRMDDSNREDMSNLAKEYNTSLTSWTS